MSSNEESKQEPQDTQPQSEGLSKAAKKRKRRQAKNKELKDVAVQEIDYWNAPIDVDPEALSSNKQEFEKGTLKEYDFWKGQPVPQFCKLTSPQ